MKHSLRALVASSVAAGAAVLALGTATPASAAPAPDVDVVAHRGSSGAAPENTLAAVRLALRQKSDVMENDIQRTADGELVIMHDTTLARTTDVEQVFPARAPWNVRDFTLAEIKQLDAGSWFAPEFAGERVPTLARVGRGRRRPGRHAARAEGARALPRDRDRARQGAALPARLQRAPCARTGCRCSRSTTPGCGPTPTWHPTCPSACSTAPGPRRPTSPRPRPGRTPVNPALGAIDEATVDAVHDAGMDDRRLDGQRRPGHAAGDPAGTSTA